MVFRAEVVEALGVPNAVNRRRHSLRISLTDLIDLVESRLTREGKLDELVEDVSMKRREYSVRCLSQANSLVRDVSFFFCVIMLLGRNG